MIWNLLENISEILVEYNIRSRLMWDGTERRKDNQDALLRIELNLERLSGEMRSSHKAFRDFQLSTEELNKKVITTLYGNGQPGLTTKINAVENLGHDFKEHDKRDLRIQFSLLAGTLGILVKILFF